MTVANAMRLRVAVPDVWDVVEVTVTPDRTVAQLKAEALVLAVGRSPNPDDYIVKFRGGRVMDESATLEAIGVPDSASLIVLPARRRPVR